MVTAAPCRASSKAMARPIPLSLPVTMAALFSRDILDPPVRSMMAMASGVGGHPTAGQATRRPSVRALREAIEEMVANAQRIGHRRQRRVHGTDAREEAGVDDIQVVNLVGTAVDVQDGRRRVGPEAGGPGLVGDAGDRDLVLEI